LSPFFRPAKCWQIIPDRKFDYNLVVIGAGAAGPYQFTHVAAHQAWYATANALFGSIKSFYADYRVIPWATYTDPEIARVGLNESDAKEKRGLPMR